ncbi:peroxiredoxin family protein [Polyangium mundeleinium]|uniref:TlpA disulfide reductase family protein n=1 Tax=Polyangium mundeleinium TaxID=2995306 RepID=A0ABT5F342_9BACT|nr:TlpA disulfide reductase family protein [Polyangium mundeleinium]MDC0748521.1 TlpA disulfide reductase family protein [Polyangium mundeleinium]
MNAQKAHVLGAALAGLLLSSCGGEMPSAKAGGGATAPDFTLPSLDGKQVRLSDYKGNSVVLIDFWSTTCDPCMIEMPHLVDLYKKHKDRGFVVLAVSADGPESRAQVSSVVRSKDMVFPVLLDEETVVTARYNPKRELPFTVLISKDGSIMHKRGGYTAGDEKTLAVEVEKALAE